MTTVCGSVAAILSTIMKVAERGLTTPSGGKAILFRLAATSSAVSLSPLWNLTSSRILKVYVLPPSVGWETYATIHSAAPFYSVLIRINPNNPESTTDIVCLALRVETRRRVRRDHVGQCAAVFRSLVGRRRREPVPAARSPELVAKIRTAANPAAASAHTRCEPWPVRGAAPSTRQRLRSRQASGSWQKGLSHSARGGTQPGRVSRPPIHHEQ